MRDSFLSSIECPQSGLFLYMLKVALFDIGRLFDEIEETKVLFSSN